MCSIMGYCGPVVDLDKFKEGFQRTISRGPDDSRIVDTGNGLLGFHRLAIMGLTPSGMQPFHWMEVTWSATEKFMDLKKSKKNCLTDIALQAIQTVRSFCPCIKNMAQICLLCWMQNSHVFSMTAIQVNILRQEIPLESVLSITDMMKRCDPVCK